MMFDTSWSPGDQIDIGWPDHGRAPLPFSIVEVQILGRVFRGRVTDGEREGGFLIIRDCPDVVLEQVADEVSSRVGYKVIASSLRCSINDEIFRSLDYEWYPTPEYESRPRELTIVVNEVVSGIFPD